MNVNLWLSRIGLGLIFCYSILASIYVYYFAQLHLSLSFLPFPVFIGEIVLFLCIPLLAGACKGSPLLSPRTRLLLWFYFGWVGLRALISYHNDGPLALRNAALFYYPVLAVFAYCFYQKARIPMNVLKALALLAGGILFFKVMNVWYWWTYMTFFVIAVWNTKSKGRWVAWGFLAAIIWLGKEYFYQGPRAHFVSVFFSFIFLAFYFGAFFIKSRHFARLGAVLAAILLFVSGYAVFQNTTR